MDSFYNAAMRMLENGELTTEEKTHEYLRILATAAVMENPTFGDMTLVPLKTLTISGSIQTLPENFNSYLIWYMEMLSNQLFLACSTPFDTEHTRVASNAETGKYSITFSFDAPITLNDNVRIIEVVNTEKIGEFHTLGAIQREYAF
jgi:hypothetical protein